MREWQDTDAETEEGMGLPDEPEEDEGPEDPPTDEEDEAED